MLDKDKIKESLTTEDVAKVMQEVGNTDYRMSGENLVFRTICHNVFNGSYKLYYFTSTKSMRCFTGCQESFDIYELVMRAKFLRGEELTFYQSVQYVANITGKHFTSNQFIISSNIISDWEWINRFEKKEKVNTKLPTYNKNALEVPLNRSNIWWRKEGISTKAMLKYGIGYYIREDKITIPHLDIDGNLIGIRGRSMSPEDVANGIKYMPLTIQKQMYNHPLSMSLYGLNYNKEVISRLKKAVIFEGEKSVLMCETFYEGNNFSVATMGSNISVFQRDMLLDLGVEEVIIAFDKYDDDTSEKGVEKKKKYVENILKQASRFTPYVRTYILWDDESLIEFKDSPCDKGKETFEKLMCNKKIVLTKED